MREIGIVPGEKQSRVLEDHLLAQGIKTKLVERPNGWAFWVIDEDRIARGTEELRAFLDEPDAARYRESSQSARALRKAEEEADRAHRKNTKELRDRWEGSAWKKYPLTVAMIAASIGVGIVTNFGDASNRLLLNPTFRALLFSDWSIGPALTPISNGWTEIARGQVWRLVTPIFLHFGLMHLVFNMLFLRSFGGMIEFRKGTLRFALLVLATAIASNIGQFLDQSRNDPLVVFGGMSGVGYGLFGYLWVKGHRYPDERLGVPNQTVILMIAWFALCASGALGPIANSAHGVGLATGMLFGLTRF